LKQATVKQSIDGFIKQLEKQKEGHLKVLSYEGNVTIRMLVKGELFAKISYPSNDNAVDAASDAMELVNQNLPEEMICHFNLHPQSRKELEEAEEQDKPIPKKIWLGVSPPVSLL
jgi:hypothetical protein